MRRRGPSRRRRRSSGPARSYPRPARSILPPPPKQDHTAVVTLTLGGASYVGLVNVADAGPITKFMYLGLPLAAGGAVVSFDDAMSQTSEEFVLVACLQTVRGCDFGSADPAAAA